MVEEARLVRVVARREPFSRDGTKTNGLSGSEKRFYKRDYTHNDIEIYNKNGQHLGSIDPQTGNLYKGAVKGRKINLG